MKYREHSALTMDILLLSSVDMDRWLQAFLAYQLSSICLHSCLLLSVFLPLSNELVCGILLWGKCSFKAGGQCQGSKFNQFLRHNAANPSSKKHEQATTLAL